MTNQNFYNQSVEEVESILQTNLKSGLSETEARNRLDRDGYNEFHKKKHKSLFMKFLDQFKSFMIIVLIIAAIISGVVGYFDGEGFTDAIIILFIVILNAIIGVFQEAKAEKSLEALEQLSSPHCKVIRDGNVHEIPSRELVAGDLVELETGDIVAADIRLAEAVNLKVQESALTGESVPVDKNTETIDGEIPVGDRINMVFSSSSITYGRGRGIVTATGMNSEVGKIASMIQSVPDTKTPMQIKLDKLGRMLAIVALIICAAIFGIGILYGHEIFAMFMTAVSLAVAAIPEGLPAVATIVLAVGVQRLVKKNAIVRKLPSVETLGSTQVICSDKTGTLTQNRMTVVMIYADGQSQDIEENTEELSEEYQKLIELSVLANDTKSNFKEGEWETLGDPTETALVDLGYKVGIVKNEIEEELPRVAEIPFDSDRKLMSTIHQQEDNLLVATKGGLDELLARCTSIYKDGEIRELSSQDEEEIKRVNEEMAQKALRVLGVAMKEIENLSDEVSTENIETDLVFVGLIGMIDPPRTEVKDAVEKCRTAGIKPVMITGDHKITAIAIAEALGIKDENEKALTGVELEKMSDEELNQQIDSISVFARVSPEHKVRIVKAFQSRGEVVAMTGDGVNDAPALKLADIGVAMGITGTDVSKEAADIVLTDDNFTTIVSAVEEGRRIYDNIIKAIQFLLSTNIGEIFVLFVAVLANWVPPLLPIHILWINLVTDSLPALALSVDPASPDVMSRKPIDSRKGIMTKTFSIRIVLQGMMIAALSLIAYRIGLKTSIELAQTMTFSVLAFTQFTLVYSVRSGANSAFKGMFNNKYLIGAMAIVTAMMLLVLFVPPLEEIFHVITLTGMEWVWVILLSLAPLAITEIAKIIVRLFKKRKG